MVQKKVKKNKKNTNKRIFFLFRDEIDNIRKIRELMV